MAPGGPCLLHFRDSTSRLFRAGGKVGGAGAGEGERVDDLVIQVLAHTLGQGGLLEGQVVVDGVVGDGRGFSGAFGSINEPRIPQCFAPSTAGN